MFFIPSREATLANLWRGSSRSAPFDQGVGVTSPLGCRKRRQAYANIERNHETAAKYKKVRLHHNIDELF